MRTRKGAVGIASAIALMLGGSVGAAPTVTITSPADGATISSATPALLLGGAVTFDTPVQTELKYYLRRATCGGSGENKRLSTNLDGGDIGGCGYVYSVTPVNEVTRLTDIYPAKDPGGGLPFTLDASRPVTGVLHLTSYIPPTNVGAGATTVDFSLSGTDAGGTAQALGSTTVSYVAMPLQPYDVAWSITPPMSLDKKDLAGLTLTVVVRGINVLHGFTTYGGASHLTVPVWSASFDRRVEVAVDGAAFSSSGISLEADLASWSGSAPTPAVGSHVIGARAVQGSQVSGVASSTVTVTA